METINYPEVGWMKERFQVIQINNQICEFDWTIEPGGSVPRHLHKECDEHFSILFGEATFLIDGKKKLAKAGDELLVERNTVHSIINKSKETAISRVSYKPTVDQGKFFQILFFLNEKSPNDKTSLLKAMYIAEQMNYKEFSTTLGGMNLLLNIIMGLIKILAPINGWKKLLKEYETLTIKNYLSDS